MRGRESDKEYDERYVGITPARAGKSEAPGGLARQPRDHPRACGEEAVEKPTVQSQIGSPPRVRGRDTGKLFDDDRAGITPARAGKSAGHGAPKCSG